MRAAARCAVAVALASVCTAGRPDAASPTALDSSRASPLHLDPSSPARLAARSSVSGERIVSGRRLSDETPTSAAELKEWLLSNQVPITSWDPKLISQLWSEIRSQRCELYVLKMTLFGHRIVTPKEAAELPGRFGTALRLVHAVHVRVTRDETLSAASSEWGGGGLIRRRVRGRDGVEIVQRFELLWTPMGVGGDVLGAARDAIKAQLGGGRRHSQLSLHPPP